MMEPRPTSYERPADDSAPESGRVERLLIEKAAEFNYENWAIRARNEFHAPVRQLNNRFDELSPAEQDDLRQAEAFFQQTHDPLHLVKLKLKTNQLVDAELAALANNPDLTHLTAWLAPQRIVEMRQAELGKLAYAYGRLDRAKTFGLLRQHPEERTTLIELFRSYADDRTGKTLVDHELAGTAYHEALRLCRNDPTLANELRTQAIGAFTAAAENRHQVGDLWWEGISRREIAKISGDPSDLAVAKSFAHRLIDELQKKGNYLRASYWVRDLQTLEPNEENLARSQQRWEQTIEQAKIDGKLRSESRAYWQWFRGLVRFNADPAEIERYRRLAINGYRQLRDVPGQRPDYIREAHIMLTELIQ